jgi:site-specific DNA recombinase
MSATSPAAALSAAAVDTNPARVPTCAVKCAVYLRISLDRNKDHLAVDRQREDCYKIARQRGWTVVEEYVDNSISAYARNVKRPAYLRMVEDFKAGKFSAIVCWDLDRLTRQPRQLEDWIDAAEDHGLLLVTANGEADLTTHNGIMFARVKMSMAAAEIAQKTARQKRAFQQRAEKGRPPVGQAAFGYLQDGTRDEAEAPFVDDVFSRFDSGDSLLSIANWLEEVGVPCRGRRWRASSVRCILTNPRYCRRVVLRGEVLADLVGNWDELVTPELFDKVQRVLTDPRRLSNRTGTHRKHLGAGLYRCGKCQERMQSHSGDAYRCQQNACMTKGRVKVDDFVLAAVAAELARPDLSDLLTPPGLESRVAEVEATIATLQAKLAKTKALLEDDDLDLDADMLKSLQVRKGKTVARLELAREERAMLWAGKAQHPIYSAEHPDEAFLAADLGPQRQVLDELFSVTLYPGVRGKWALDPATVDIRFKRALAAA